MRIAAPPAAMQKPRRTVAAQACPKDLAELEYQGDAGRARERLRHKGWRIADLTGDAPVLPSCEVETCCTEAKWLVLAVQAGLLSCGCPRHLSVEAKLHAFAFAIA